MKTRTLTMKVITLHTLFALVCTVSMPTVTAAELDIVVFGASGRIGQVIVDEALQRGHQVRGVSRDPAKLTQRHPRFNAVQGDVKDLASLRGLARGADAFVITISARAPDNRPENSLLVSATRNIIEVLSDLEKPPYIVQMGGANLMYGSSYEEVSRNMQGQRFNYEPGSSMYGVLFGHQLSLEMYRASDLDWSVIAPPMQIIGIYGEPDTTTGPGGYRFSTTGPVIADDGSKRIYVRDLARAVVDEIQERAYKRQLFTVAY